MCRLIETIQIKNGKILLLPFHQERMNTSILQVFKINNTINLEDEIIIPNNALIGIWKCRIVYSTIIEEITFTPYLYRIINSLQLIEAPNLNYTYKYEDRKIFDSLIQLKNNCDDILITQNGFITDTSYSNIVFFDNKEWITPTTYLLRGTKREFLLQTNRIKEKPITINNLKDYKKARLLNCFYDLENGNDIDIIDVRCK